uniref:Uncharacterized protein n=1 Tax=Anguilla anguilla TaxID=7936 RepID=A0A0E9RR51_ANGAN
MKGNGWYTDIISCNPQSPFYEITSPRCQRPVCFFLSKLTLYNNVV